MAHRLYDAFFDQPPTLRIAPDPSGHAVDRVDPCWRASDLVTLLPPGAAIDVGHLAIGHGWIRRPDATRSVTSFTASILNARLNFRLAMSILQFHGHDLVFVSTEPAAAHSSERRGWASEM
jgi:hypothetical protein